MNFSFLLPECVVGHKALKSSNKKEKSQDYFITSLN